MYQYAYLRNHAIGVASLATASPAAVTWDEKTLQGTEPRYACYRGRLYFDH